MKRTAGWKLGALGTFVLLACGAWAQDAARKGPDALKAEIETLKAPRVAWREISWRSCILEGLRESAEKKKPMLLWVFIDRPVDDKRC